MKAERKKSENIRNFLKTIRETDEDMLQNPQHIKTINQSRNNKID